MGADPWRHVAVPRGCARCRWVDAASGPFRRGSTPREAMRSAVCGGCRKSVEDYPCATTLADSLAESPRRAPPALCPAPRGGSLGASKGVHHRCKLRREVSGQEDQPDRANALVGAGGLNSRSILLSRARDKHAGGFFPCIFDGIVWNYAGVGVTSIEAIQSSLRGVVSAGLGTGKL